MMSRTSKKAQKVKADSALTKDVQNVKADPALTNDGHKSIWTNTYRESSQKCGFDLTNSNVKCCFSAKFG